MKRINLKISMALICLILSGCANGKTLNDVTSINSIDEKKEYFDNGKIANIVKFQNGSEIERIYYIYFETGELDSKITYKNNQIVLKEIFHKSGRLLVSEPYLNDLLNGDVKAYQTNGKLFSITTFLNGKREGASILYDIYGKAIKELKYSNDNLVEENWYEYYDSGELKYKRPIKNGKVNGVVTKYYKNGIKEIEANFADGIFNADYKNYYDNGTLKLSTNYLNGKKNGIEKTYFKNGKIRTEIEFKDGNPSNEYIYDLNGSKTKMTDEDFKKLLVDY